MLAPRLVQNGLWEAWVTLALGRSIQPGFHCVDVGANYGYYTLLMAGACQRGGRVLACEPNSLLAQTYLPGNVALNGFRDRVEICQKVIGDINAEQVEFVLHDGDYATSSLKRWANPQEHWMLWIQR
jgi:FkbM family methyltransferase